VQGLLIVDEQKAINSAIKQQQVARQLLLRAIGPGLQHGINQIDSRPSQRNYMHNARYVCA
jgi:hypothetical protein